MGEHVKNIVKLMRELSYRHSLWTVFKDFIELSAIAISNAVDGRKYNERENRYLEVIGSYSKNEADIFPKMLSELILELEKEATDVLGKIYMELDLGNRWKGQFFTPMSICKACGAITVSDLKDTIKRKGFITVSEPACGGGAMIIGLALAMQEAGLNYQQSMLVTAADVDIMAVHMTYVQLSLLGIPAVICHGNSLTCEEYSHWVTPTYVLGGWRWRKQNQLADKEPVKLRLEENQQYSFLDLVG